MLRYRRVLGDDDPTTLASAHALVIDLRQAGQHARAREIGEVVVFAPAWASATRYPDTVAGAAGIATRSWARQNAVNKVHTDR